MDQIKSLFTPSKFKVWVRHVESHTRDERYKDTVIGTSYLKGIWDKKANAYRATKFHIHPEFRYMGYQVDLFKAALELLSSAHKKLISDDVITSNQRKHIDQVIQQGHVRKDLPFGAYLLDSPRRKTMNKTAKSQEDPKVKRHPPKVTRPTEGFIWSMGDSLARALREPQGGQTGDSRFWVSGLSTSSWSVKHPDLEILESGESPLIMRIRKVGTGEWRVEGQNQLQNLKNTEILSVEKTPPTPNRTWELDYIAARAADYFLKQKDKIMELKQSMQPQQPPGAGTPAAPPGGGEGGMGGGMGGGMPPMASRRARATLANLRKAQTIVTGLRRRYGSQGWFRGARTVNDRDGIGIVVRLKGLPQGSGGRLKASLGGIPVEWQDGGRRVAIQKGFGAFLPGQENWVGWIVSDRGEVLALDHDEDHEWIIKEDIPELRGMKTERELYDHGFALLRHFNTDLAVNCTRSVTNEAFRKVLDIVLRKNDAKTVSFFDRGDNNAKWIQFDRKDFLLLKYPSQMWRGPRVGNRQVTTGKKEEPQEESHEALVNRAYRYLLSRKRLYGSVKYLAYKLKVDPKKLAKALGELIVQERIDFTSRKFKPVIPPVKPKEDLVAIRTSQSVYRTDKGNWRTPDQLRSTMITEVPTQDAPEERNNAYSRIMPDPTRPN